jgi:alpha-N-arabinofuranosidase
VLAEGPGTVDLDMVSVFPEDTWQGRENGLRKDPRAASERHEARVPSLPGGCIVEGRFLDGATSGRRQSAIRPNGR